MEAADRAFGVFFFFLVAVDGAAAGVVTPGVAVSNVVVANVAATVMTETGVSLAGVAASGVAAAGVVTPGRGGGGRGDGGRNVRGVSRRYDRRQGGINYWLKRPTIVLQDLATQRIIFLVGDSHYLAGVV